MSKKAFSIGSFENIIPPDAQKKCNLRRIQKTRIGRLNIDDILKKEVITTRF
jgi:hypothetical protein